MKHEQQIVIKRWIPILKEYEESNVFLCPEGNEVHYWGIHKLSRQHAYRARTKDCKICPKKPECTKDRARSVSYHI